MTFKKKFTLIFLSALLLFTLTACGDKSPVAGKWEDTNGNLYHFNSGRLTISNQDNKSTIGATYTLDKESNTITIKVEIGDVITEESATFSVEDKTLTITGADGSSSVLTKK